MLKKILGIVLILSSVLFLGCKKSSEPTSSPQMEIISQDSAETLAKIQENLLKAKEAVKSWKGNAQFVSLVLKISPEAKVNTLTETFVFGSTDDTANWWTYSISEETGKIVRSVTPKEDYLETDLLPIKEEYWKISYIEAIKTAEENGGTTFRAKFPKTQINAVLAQSSPKGWLWWQINYVSPSDNLEILVNASDGKIYNQEAEKPI